MTGVSVIIPVWNLQAVRDPDRLRFSILSLLNQQAPPASILVVDGSMSVEYQSENQAIVDEFPPIVRRLYVDMPTFNKPMLLNEGVRNTNTEFVLCTDADYLFSPDILKAAEKLRRPDRLILHRAQTLPEMVISTNQVKQWKFGVYPFFEFGLWACGAFQYFHRDWFEYSGGYDERLAGHGGMDHDFRDRCDRARGFHTKWMNQGQILHQWHPISKAKTPEAKKRFHRNIHIARHDKTIKRN